MPASQAKQKRSRISLESASDREFARHILTFDSDKPETYSAHTLPPAAIMRAAADRQFRGRRAKPRHHRQCVRSRIHRPR